MSQRTIHDDKSPLPPPPIASSNNNSTPLSLSGTLPPPPTQTHRTWYPIYIHSAKCDGCHMKKHKVLQRCDSCTLQYCEACMPKAAENAHEYDESKLNWDPSQATPTFRDRSSMKKKKERREPLPPKSKFGAFVLNDEDELEEESGMVDEISGRVGKAGSVGGGGARGGSYRGTRGSNERLLSEAEKYHPPGYGATFVGNRGGNGPESGRYANQEMLAGDDDGYSTLLNLNKRQRMDYPSLERSAAYQRFDDQRFNDRVFDSPRSGRTQASSLSNRCHPNNRQQPLSRQQEASHASLASCRREQAQQQQQQQLGGPQVDKSTIRRAASMLAIDSSFEDATDAVMKAREDEASLPARRRQLEEYCRDRWRDEPILRQLREDGQVGEAEELYLASKAALYVAYQLGDEFGQDDG